ncbi:MAG: RNA polymerase sigma factor [Chitinophagaceae bacterium]|nr:RNA polymerase sigma factor [Chitinophagaceae bacterium]
MSEKSIEISDNEIMQMFRNADGREKAFTLLVKKYQERLYWHIRRILVSHDDTDDLLQNVFIKVWRHLDNFKQDSELFTWLYRIATNTSLTFLKEKKQSKGTYSLSDYDNYFENTIKAEKGFDIKKVEWKLQMAIHSLPEKQKLVFNLRYYDEMPYEKMSEVLETSVGALKASYHFAAKKIEEYLNTN